MVSIDLLSDRWVPSKAEDKANEIEGSNTDDMSAKVIKNLIFSTLNSLKK